MRIFSIVTIEESNSLLCHMFFLNPMFDHFGKCLNIHKFHIVYMSKLLPFDHNTWRDTFIAHSFGIRLMIFTVSVNLVLNLWRRKAISTFNLWWMNSFAFKFLIQQKLIEWNVSSIWNKLLIQAMDALCIRPMLTQPFHLLLFIFWVIVGAIEASSPRSMVAFRFIFIFFIFLPFFLIWNNAV